MAKQILYGNEARAALQAGIDKLSDTVKVTLNGPLSPITVVPVEGDSFLFLVLPVRLRNEK